MTLLIKNGLVYSGRDEEPEKKDIFIRGDRIVRFGVFSRSAADRVIDAHGFLVAPGFVDTGSDFDHYLGVFSEEVQRKFVERGVTSIIGGNFGVSLAPFNEKAGVFLYRPYEATLGNIDWHSLPDLLKTLLRRRISLNFGTMVGHINLKNFFTNGEARDLTDGEMADYLRLFRESLEAGAFGISFDFAHFLSRKISYGEILKLVRIAAVLKRVAAFHLDTEAGYFNQIEMVSRIAEDSQASVQINNLDEVSLGLKSGVSKLKDTLTRGAARLNLDFDFAPGVFKSAPIFEFMPKQFQKLNLEEMLQVVFQNQRRDEFATRARKIDLNKIWIGYMPKEFYFLRGRSLTAFAAGRGVAQKYAIWELMRLSKLRAVLIFEKKKIKNLGALLETRNSSIASAGLIAASGEEKDFYNLAEIRAIFGKRAALQKILQKMTLAPSRKYGLLERGSVAEGSYADLIFLREDKVMKTIVNGKLVFEDGKFLKVYPGRVLRR